MNNIDDEIKILNEEIEKLSIKYNKSLEEDENAIGDEKVAIELMKKTRELKKILNNKYKSETMKSAPLVEENKTFKESNKKPIFNKNMLFGIIPGVILIIVILITFKNKKEVNHEE